MQSSLCATATTSTADATSHRAYFPPERTPTPPLARYMRDQFSTRVDRARACLLRCYPHEWSLLFEEHDSLTQWDAPSDRMDQAGASQAVWRYAGRFDGPPRAEQLEALLEAEMTRVRDRVVMQRRGAPK